MDLRRDKIFGLFVFSGMILLRATAADFLTATHLVADLNVGTNGSFPTNLTTFSGTLYFNAYTRTYGEELWKYDGNTIVLASNINDTVTDIGPGVFIGNSSSPKGFTAYKDRLYFSAYEPRRGAELWSYDGTNATRAADINPDANDTIKITPRNSFPSQLTVFNDLLYFSADSGIQSDYELWRYNGTNATIVTNINPGNYASSFPTGLTPFQNALYFMADDGSHGFELWKHTGTETVWFDINPGASNAYPKYFLPLDGNLYFQAFHPDHGFELWKTEGNAPIIAADIFPGPDSSFAEFLTAYRSNVYFRATDGINGYELWKYDGTNSTIAADINPVGDSFPKNLTVFNDQLFFAATDGTSGWELWKYDGSAATLVTNLNPLGDSFPESLTVFDNHLYFVATTPETGYELWRTDGNIVTLATDIVHGTNNSFPQYFQIYNGQLFFSAVGDGASDYELWTLLTAPLRIQSLQKTGENMQISWSTLGGTTNIVQASENAVGPYTNLSAPILIPGVAHTTNNFVDPESATAPARFYRIVAP